MSTTALRKSLMAITVAAFCAAAISLLALAAPASAAGKLNNEIPDKVQITGEVTSGTVHCYADIDNGGITRVDLKSATLVGSIIVNDEEAVIRNSGKSYVKEGEIWFANGGEFRGTGTLYSYSRIYFSSWGRVDNDSSSSKYPFTLRAYEGIICQDSEFAVYGKAKVYAKDTDGTAIRAASLTIFKGYVNAKGKVYGIYVDDEVCLKKSSANKIYAYSTAASSEGEYERFAAIKCGEMYNSGYVYAKASGKKSVGILCDKSLQLKSDSTTKAYAKYSGGVGIGFTGEAKFDDAYVVAKGYNCGIRGYGAVIDGDPISPTLMIDDGKTYAYGVNTKDKKVGSGIYLEAYDPDSETVELAYIGISGGAYVKARAKSSTSKFGIKCVGPVNISKSKVYVYAKKGYAIGGVDVVGNQSVHVYGKSVIKVNGVKQSNFKNNY